MPEFLQNLLDGARLLRMGGGMQRDYPQYQGFAEDARNLAGDWRCVGNDLRDSLKKERAHHQARRATHGK